MANNPLPDDLRNLWQKQPLENNSVSLNEIRLRASKFERRISRRNLREYIAGLACVIAFGCYIWKIDKPLMKIGSAVNIAGVVFVLWQLHRRGGAEPVPEDLGLASSIEFHRSQLIRQRDLLRGVLWWYLAPLFPGMLLMLAGSLPRGIPEPRQFLNMLPFLVLLTAVTVGVWWMNKRGADRLERQIAELDRLEEQP